MFSLLVLLSRAGPAAASCALPPGDEGPRWADSEIVILGTVRAVADHKRVATVVVEEIWRGPDMPSEVTVHGGFATGDSFTSGDRTFDSGVRYLFDLDGDQDGNLQDNACSLTTPWSAELVALRPADARSVAIDAAPATDATGLDGPIGIVLAVGLVALILLGAAFGIRRLDV